MQPSVIQLPRGGTYVRTSAGAIQFGIPPETIKDAMAMQLDVPIAWVVPHELFARRRGISIAEFEFPAYYNFFVLKRRVRLVVDDAGIEQRVRAVFQETLFGPRTNPSEGEFADSIPLDGRPDTLREGAFFRVRPDGTRIEVDDLVDFVHLDEGPAEVAPDVVIEVMPGSYSLRERGREIARIPDTTYLPEKKQNTDPPIKPFDPPRFGVSVLGASHGFDPVGRTTGFLLWMGGRALVVDPPIDATEYLRLQGVAPKIIDGVILTHCHADHDSGTFQKILEEGRTTLYTTPHILGSFLRKWSAIYGLGEDVLRRLFHFHPVRIGAPTRIHGGEIWFHYSLHSIPTIGLSAYYGGKSVYISSDTLYEPSRIQEMFDKGVLGRARFEALVDFPGHHSVVLHEAGVPPLHTPTSALAALSDSVKERLRLVHIAAKDVPAGTGLQRAGVGLEHTIRLDVSPPAHGEAIELLNVMASVDFLRELQLSRVAELLQVARRVHFPAKARIVTQGTRGASFYIIANGMVAIVQNDREVETYQAGDYFGETASILDQPRSADVIAKTDVDLIVIEGREFLSVLRGTSIPRRLARLARMRAEGTWALMGDNSVLSQMTASQKNQLQAILEPCRVADGEILWSRDAPARRAFLIEDARVVLDTVTEGMPATMRSAGSSASVRPFTRGAFLGEIDALRTESAPSSMARVIAGGRVFAIDRKALLKFFEDNPGLLVSFLGTRFVE
jgi:CRP-like cAMP-binding protein/phosphoribosyl 1,2-cyclic phosphodiesterase